LNAIESCADLFTRFGGHAFAIGFALPAGALPELKRRLRIYAEEHLAAREAERLLRIHAELPLDRITPVLAGWLRKLEPLGHGNPEPMFVARRARLVAAPRFMKERHLRLELAQESSTSATQSGSSGVTRAVGWDLAGRSAELALKTGSLIDLVYRIRENDHPEFGGLEVEIAGMELADA
jgi:single-stranded-DNA-specific exonuclease